MSFSPRKTRYVTVNRRASDDAVSFWPMSLSQSVDANVGGTAPVVTFVDGGTVNSVNKGSNDWRAVKFLALHEALSRMSKLPKGHEFHLDENAGKRASVLLAVMAENYQVSPPKLIPEDGDAVAFTWDYGQLKRYLTVDQDDVDVMELHKERRIRCHHEISIEHDSYGELMGLLGVNPLSSSVMGTDV